MAGDRVSCCTAVLLAIGPGLLAALPIRSASEHGADRGIMINIGIYNTRAAPAQLVTLHTLPETYKNGEGTWHLAAPAAE